MKKLRSIAVWFSEDETENTYNIASNPSNPNIKIKTDMI